MGKPFGARWTWSAGVGLAIGVVAAPAGAIEFWDERIQIHGFYETRLSFGWEDFDASKDIDMYAWLHVLSIEAEAEIAPEGWGPFDLVAAFARVEVKYDCVWNHACGLLPSVDAFGNEPNNLPHRAQTGRRLGLAGSQLIHDRRPWWFADRVRMAGGLHADAKAGQRDANSLVFGSTTALLGSASAGPDTVLGEWSDIRNESGPNAFFYNGTMTDPTTMLPGDDDAGTYMWNKSKRCDVGNWELKLNTQRGQAMNRELLWGIDDCPVRPTGFQRTVANPFRDEALFGTDPMTGGDRNPVLLAINRDPGAGTPAGSAFGLPLDPNGNGIPNATALPYRPGTELNINEKGPNWMSQGIWLPNARTRRELRRGSFTNTDQNFTLNELQWNRGAAQERWKELRELYLELEAFESRLWVRAGKQTIVWGKTELFRNQDQWNPVDIAIGPLASLEEARIALWGLRGIWSFYEVGPLEDVRLELVGLFDEFEPTDIGRCGEPFVPRLACNKSYGLWVHGTTGVGTGVAGEIRPEDGWSDIEGIEVGARIEFRYDRFSFALTDYWGYQDTPYISLLFQYDRNVDPISGRPRHTMARGVCGRDGTADEPDCLLPGMDPDPTDPIDDGIVANHSINQSLFASICAGTVGVAPAVDSAACAFTLFNSSNNVGIGPFNQVFSSILAGASAGQGRYRAVTGDLGTGSTGPLINNALDAAFGATGTNTLFAPGTPLVPLTYDGVGDNGTPTLPGPVAAQGRLAHLLTNEQEALLGCGLFYQTDCDAHLPGPDAMAGTADDIPGGVDLANTAADVSLQSFPWFEGTFFNPSWDTADATLAQPGTIDAVINDGPGGGVDSPFSKVGGVETGAVGTRYEDDGNGIDDDGDGNVKDLFILPGARYDAAVLGPAIAAAQAAGGTVSPYLMRHLALYDVTVDGSTGGKTHPFTGQLFAGEMAILSFNFLMLTAGLGATDGTVNRGTLDRVNPLALGRCSYRQPQYCAFVSGLAAQARNTRTSFRAAGNGRFGRRHFVWSGVGDLALRYDKRNILGFSMDFAEDTTKSSWGVEFTFIDDALNADNDEYDLQTFLDEYNLTVSVDRPTFINFLNANRTFFMNSQLFVSYLQGYTPNVLRDGPWTALWLVNANTGYFQDRFLVSAAGVYDFTSQSAAFLPSVQYRFTENFSIAIGAAVLAGKWKGRDMGINQFSASSDVNLNDSVYVENGISPARDLDNFFVRLRYTY